MLRRELELQAKALGIRGYSSMRMADLVTRIDIESAAPVLSAEEQARVIERNDAELAAARVIDSGPVVVKAVKRSPVTHQCRHCKHAYDESEMFMSARVKAEHGIEAWFCRDTQACTARVSE